MNSEQEHRAKIQKYYTIAQPFYEYFWHGKAWGLHYGFWIGSVSRRTEAIIKENEYLANLVDIKRDDLVLDAGCGVGGSGIWLAENRGANVVGLNIVDKQLIKGKNLVRKRELPQETDFVKGDFQLLPFKDEVFDVFWSLESIEHATNLKYFMQEAFRVLKPGGRIIAATFLGDRKDISPEEKRQMDVGQSVAGCFNDFRSAQANIEIMREVGFVNLQNLDKTAWVMKSAEQMAKMCRVLGVPAAKILSPLHENFRIILKNNQWGTYQEGLFKSGATSYNVLLANKP